MSRALLTVVLTVGSVALLGCGPRKEPINLSQLRGTAINGQTIGGSVADSRVLVLNVFGSWCAPCIAEADGYGAAYDKYRSRGVQFIGLAERESSQTNVETFIAAHHLRYPVLYDNGAKIELQVVPDATTPTTYIFRRGVLVDRRSGEVEYTTLDAAIAKALR